MRKFAKGAGVAALALIIFEAVKFVISELIKPGRFLDTRFKRDIREEILQFQRRQDQQNLRRGFSNVIITSSPRLRGSTNQAAQTTYSLNLVRTNQIPNSIGWNPISNLAAGQSPRNTRGTRGGGGGRFIP
jgi:hypothetical protein